MIALESDISDVRFSEKRHPAELALGDALLEVIAAEHVIEVFCTVNPVLALFGCNNQTNMIPLPDGLSSVERLAGLGINRRLI